MGYSEIILTYTIPIACFGMAHKYC